jgi:hypothetical protein
MAQPPIHWGSITLFLDNEAFQKAFSQRRSRYCDDCEYDTSQVAQP